MSIDRTSSDFADQLIDAARRHGEDSETDHEVGDLQDLFRSCWCIMSTEQRGLAMSDPIVMGLFEGPEYEDL